MMKPIESERGSHWQGVVLARALVDGEATLVEAEKVAWLGA